MNAFGYSVHNELKEEMETCTHMLKFLWTIIRDYFKYMIPPTGWAHYNHGVWQKRGLRFDLVLDVYGYVRELSTPEILSTRDFKSPYKNILTDQELEKLLQVMKTLYDKIKNWDKTIKTTPNEIVDFLLDIAHIESLDVVEAYVKALELRLE